MIWKMRCENVSICICSVDELLTTSYNLIYMKQIIKYPNGNIYEGEVQSNKPHGSGQMIYQEGNTYVGEFKNGLKSGFGLIKYVSGDSYEGEWLNDVWNGNGKETHIDKSFYEGEYRNDEKNGYGIYVYGDGTQYSGYWQQNKKSGYGVCRFDNGDAYFGNWYDGQKHGEGKYVFSNGCQYEGQFKNDRKHGFGLENCPCQSWYCGNYVKDKKCGRGKEIFKCGSTYDGYYKLDEPHGKGIFTFSNGNIYEGEFRNGKQNGYGRLLQVTGDVYEGEWKNGVYHGKQLVTKLSGELYEEIWEFNQKISSERIQIEAVAEKTSFYQQMWQKFQDKSCEVVESSQDTNVADCPFKKLVKMIFSSSQQCPLQACAKAKMPSKIPLQYIDSILLSFQCCRLQLVQFYNQITKEVIVLPDHERSQLISQNFTTGLDTALTISDVLDPSVDVQLSLRRSVIQKFKNQVINKLSQSKAKVCQSTPFLIALDEQDPCCQEFVESVTSFAQQAAGDPIVRDVQFEREVLDGSDEAPNKKMAVSSAQLNGYQQNQQVALLAAYRKVAIRPGLVFRQTTMACFSGLLGAKMSIAIGSRFALIDSKTTKVMELVKYPARYEDCEHTFEVVHEMANTPSNIVNLSLATAQTARFDQLLGSQQRNIIATNDPMAYTVSKLLQPKCCFCCPKGTIQLESVGSQGFCVLNHVVAMNGLVEHIIKGQTESLDIKQKVFQFGVELCKIDTKKRDKFIDECQAELRQMLKDKK